MEGTGQKKRNPGHHAERCHNKLWWLLSQNWTLWWERLQCEHWKTQHKWWRDPTRLLPTQWLCGLIGWFWDVFSFSKKEAVNHQKKTNARQRLELWEHAILLQKPFVTPHPTPTLSCPCILTHFLVNTKTQILWQWFLRCPMCMQHSSHSMAHKERPLRRKHPLWHVACCTLNLPSNTASRQVQVE